LTPNDPYSCRTAPLTSKCCVLCIYSPNIGTEYFKHGIYSPFFFSSKCSLFHNSNVFGLCFIHILYTGCAKIYKNNSGAKRLINSYVLIRHRNILTIGNPIFFFLILICALNKIFFFWRRQHFKWQKIWLELR